MKRSYNSSGPPASGPPQPGPYGAATYHAPPQPAHPPPLPAGPPPPPPNGQYSQYPQYAAPAAPAGAPQQHQVAQHPQYPGYGYGGQVAQSQPPPAAPVPAAQDAAAAAYAAQYAAYYAAYAQAAHAQAAQASSASPYPNSNPGVAAQPPTTAYAGAPPPGLSATPHFQVQQPVHSQGAPPYKRTRYDQPPMAAPAQPPLPPGPPPPMPPSVLPPVGGRGPPPRSSSSGGPHSSRGPPINNSRDQYYGQDHASYGGGGGGRGGSPGPTRGGGGGGRGPRNGASSMSMGPPLPSGPRAPRAGPSSSNRDDRGPSRGNSSRSGPISSGPSSSSSRPLSGLPGSHKYSAPSRGGGAPLSIPNAPKGPKSLANSASTSTSSPRRGDRKWGSSAPGDSRRPSDRDRERDRDRDRDGEGGKRTLTDFRIEGLAIEELDWSWSKAEEKDDRKVEETEREKEMDDRKAEETEREEEGTQEEAQEDSENEAEVPAGEKTDADAKPLPAQEGGQGPTRDGVSIPEADVNVDGAVTRQEETRSEQEAEDAADMSIDGAGRLPSEEAPELASAPILIETSSSKSGLPGSTAGKGKHARPEDDSATEDSTNEEEKVRKERETKTKKVKVEQPSEEGSHPADEADQTEDEKDLGSATTTSADAVPSKPSVPQLTHPLPSKPVTVPTGPKSVHAPPSTRSRSAPAKEATLVPAPPPPSSRENSRLRIYFSSPVPISSSSASTAASQRTPAPLLHDKHSAKVESNRKEQPTPVRSNANAPPASGKPSQVSENVDIIKQEDHDGEELGGADIDGEDVDGEELDGEIVEDGKAEELDVDDERVDGPLEHRQEEPGENVEDTAEAAVKDEELGSAPAGAEDTEEKPPPTGETSQHPSPAAAPAMLPLIVPPPEPTADRISISYARNTRRMVIDAEVVGSVKISRSSGKIEVVVNCQPSVVTVGERKLEDEYRICKGILVEALDPEADDYIVMDRASLEDAWRQHERPEANPSTLEGPLLPPLHHFLTHPSPNEEPTLSILPSTSFSHPSFTITAQLDRANPLTEARWVKTGEVENWILSLGIANGQDPKDPEQLSKWLGKIIVEDPDESPTIQHALDSWATSSNIGSLEERKEFVKTHMSNIDNVVEILLRLSRGDRTGPLHHSAPGYSQPSTVGALATQLSAPFPTQQTQVSLAILAMFRLTVETAEKAGIDKSEIEKQVSEIVRNVPYHLQFKALDGMFRETIDPRVLKSGRSDFGDQPQEDGKGSGDGADEEEEEEEDQDKVYDVERILDYVCARPEGQATYEVMYLVKWVGYDDPKRNTWEPSSSFDSEAVLQDLWQECERAKPAEESHAAVVREVIEANRRASSISRKRTRPKKRKPSLDSVASTSTSTSKKTRTTTSTASTSRDPLVRKSRSKRTGELWDQTVFNEFVQEGAPKELRGLRFTPPPAARGPEITEGSLSVSPSGTKETKNRGMYKKGDGRIRGRKGRKKSLARISPTTSEIKSEEEASTASDVGAHSEARLRLSIPNEVAQPASTPRGFAGSSDDEEHNPEDAQLALAGPISNEPNTGGSNSKGAADERDNLEDVVQTRAAIDISAPPHSTSEAAQKRVGSESESEASGPAKKRKERTLGSGVEKNGDVSLGGTRSTVSSANRQLSPEDALKTLKIGRVSKEGIRPRPSKDQRSPSAVDDSTTDQLSNSTIDQQSTSLSGSGQNRKKEEDPLNHGLARATSKDGFILVKSELLLQQKLPERICGRESPKWPLSMSDPERIRWWWKIGANPLENFVNFDRILSGREVYISPPPTAKEIGKSKIAKAHSLDYQALQLVLANVDGVRQADSIRNSITAVFVHATQASELGRFPGKLAELDHLRGRTDVVCFFYGTGEDGQRASRQFWKPLTAITFSSSVLLDSPLRLSNLLSDASTRRSKYDGRRNMFPFMLPQYLLRGGALQSAIDSEGNEIGPTHEEKAVRDTAMDSVFTLLRTNKLLLARISPLPGASRLDSTGFPLEKDRTPAHPAIWTKLSQCYQPQYCDVSLERVEKIVCTWRSQYASIRRWIIIATPEEIATLSAAPGVSVWTLEEAEERLKSPLPEIIG
ncbi:hypothetical protein JCM16303_002903 [Sporobolomyces ruberrimus]